jgi:hypothetical protein
MTDVSLCKVPETIAVKLSDFITAHRQMLKYFNLDRQMEYPGDYTESYYLELTEELYDKDPSDSAAALIWEAKRAFAVYLNDRNAISF